MKNRRNIMRIVVAIIMCLVIIAIPLSVMLVARNIDNNGGDNTEIVAPNDGANNGSVDDNNAGSESNNSDNEDSNIEEGKEPQNIRVTLTIDASQLFGEVGAPYIDNIKMSLGDELFNALNSGNILVEYAMTLEPKSSVMKATKKAVTDNNILISEYNGYIGSIAGLSEKKAGKMSGWVYVVNDKTIMLGANSCVLKDGDHVKWMYKVGDR